MISSHVTRIVDPLEAPVALAELKLDLRVDDDAEDALIFAYLRAATAEIDGPHGWLGRALITQELSLSIDWGFPGCAGDIVLPLPPLQSVEAVKYIDLAGDEQTLSANAYRVLTDREPGVIAPVVAWPDTRCQRAAVSVEYTAGYGDFATDVPEDIRDFLRARVATRYLQREQIVVGTSAATVVHMERALDKYRVALEW